MTTIRASIAMLAAIVAGVSVAIAAAAAPTPAPKIAVNPTLTISKAGSGAGVVTSNVGAINCGPTCSDSYAPGTVIILTATPAAGNQFTGWLGPCTGAGACSVTLNAATTAIATFAPAALGAPTLDIDGSNSFDALTDGLLAIRYLFGLSGASLINGAVGPTATRTTAAQIGGYLDDIRPALDVDGNGQVDALTDGLLIIRYLFGLRGASLISGAVGPGATRILAGDLEAALVAVSTPGNGIPPDPASVAPPVDPTVPTTLFNGTGFLYTGGNPVQTGVVPGTIVPKRAAVLRGTVHGRDGAPLSGVKITILAHPEFGQTKTRADGAFDMAVNGGGPLTVNYDKADFLPVQRQLDVPWQDYVGLPDVVMIALDTQVTSIAVNAATIQVARGSPASDGDGARRATILFPAGTSATMVMPNGSTQPMSTLNVRATEFTVGANGPNAMPGALPAASGYTYAVELSADEALGAGATSIQFNQPLPFYVENFLGFPVGSLVPLGFYDRVRGQWVAADNGRVIAVIGISNSMADLDLSGNGQVATPTALAALGITDSERERLALLYSPGQQLWRAAIPHFSPWDCNWPYGPPPDSDPPGGDDCNDTDTCPGPKPDDPPNGDPDGDCGSVIGCETQTLGEAINVTGTPYSLHYQSSRVPGRRSTNMLKIRLSGATLPPGLLRIYMEISIAGRAIAQDFAPQANLAYTFTWDGKDAYGREVQGRQPVQVRIGYAYIAQYYATSGDVMASYNRFGTPPNTVGPGGGPVVFSRPAARTQIILWRDYAAALGRLDKPDIGGWSLSVHHAYDIGSRALYLGNGDQRSVKAAADAIIETVAGDGNYGSGGDGGPATAAQLGTAFGVAVGADGSFYIADSYNQRIRRVGPDGIITTVAGDGTTGFSGDGGPATAAQFSFPYGVAVGPDGSLYIADRENNRIRRVLNGIITTVAGNGVAGVTGDGGPATAAKLANTASLAVGPDGSIYI
ncbi:MAG: hypothetical protein ABI831_10085, partial [Betaproteobacteria bacterium]